MTFLTFSKKLRNILELFSKYFLTTFSNDVLMAVKATQNKQSPCLKLKGGLKCDFFLLVVVVKIFCCCCCKNTFLLVVVKIFGQFFCVLL